MIKRILVPVDGSANATRAVEMASALARSCGAAVELLHVIRNLSLPKEILAMIARGEVTESRMELLQDSAEIILDRAREKLEAAGVAEVTAQYLIGDPADTIAAYAAAQGSDLIVIGAQGLESSGPMLGGVARKLANSATVSCLIVR
jgi:nucleotide-binding universal stress UspA family protein